MNALMRLFITMFITTAVLVCLVAAKALASDKQTIIESSCEERGFAYGTTEQLFCLQFHKARNSQIMVDYGPSLCFACTQICAEEREDYAACRARCERACGLSPRVGTAVADTPKTGSGAQEMGRTMH